MVVRAARPLAPAEGPEKPGRFALDWAELSYHLLTPDSGDERYFEAYECWKSVWQETFLELDDLERLHSDDFTRQNEIGALFHGEVCVGLTGCRFVDLSRPAHRDDSYFKVWPASALEQLTCEGSRVCIGSNLTVVPDWRGRDFGVSVKELLMILSVRRFLVSDADVLAGTMRNGRGMHRLVYRLGARSIYTGAIHHGVEVDLIGFYRSSSARDATRLKHGAPESWIQAQFARRLPAAPRVSA